MGRLTPAQQRLFEAPRARLELYDLAKDPWELRNITGDSAYAEELGHCETSNVPPPDARWGRPGPT